MPPPRRPRVDHISVRLRVSVDPAKLAELYGVAATDAADWTRRFVVSLIDESAAAQHGAIVDVRRDQL